MGSPLMTSFWVPLQNDWANVEVWQGWMLVARYFAFSALAIAAMFGVTALLLQKRVGMTGR